MDILTANRHSFDTIVGQDLVKRFLLRSYELGRLPQALMFSGPAGVGKRSLMYALAKHVVSAGGDPSSDKVRKAYGKIERGTHPDVLVIEPRSASGQILVGQIEEMHERAHYAPLESPSRIIMIAPVEAMNVASSNNLLKLLEEPPPNLMLFLSSQNLHQTLPTIRSRCAMLRCAPVETELLTEWLIEKTGASRRRAETAARLSAGRPGVALELVSGQDEERRRKLAGELEFFNKEGYPSIFRVGRNILEMSGGTSEAATMLLQWFRDLLVASLTREGQGINDALLINRDLVEEVEQAVKRHSPQGLSKALEKILERSEITGKPFVEGDLAMEVLLTDLGKVLKA